MFCCNLSHFEMTFLFCFCFCFFLYLIKKAGVELTTVTLLEVLE